ncbi:MAG TPA: class I SAM-dependent methyltransferase [Candidatus Limnocylindrales bacterium]|jgi:cyclopropane fatty-acyl-phospholipid synthase-like methyltransferase|nr:class I SAM-dependent methyltransferase [Candidatus Limnocylindrales bacterium]
MAGGSWDDAYRGGRAPWDIGRPQPAIVRVAGAGELTGHVLDVGCGSGEHALLASTMGLQVTGVDVSRIAIERARAKARQRGLIAEFLVGNVLDLEDVDRLDPPFDTVIDVGCFHTFANADRPLYARSLAAVTEPGGVLHLLCFSELTPGTDGPRRVTEAELRTTFSTDWRVQRVTADSFAVAGGWEGSEPSAWLARIVRR